MKRRLDPKAQLEAQAKLLRARIDSEVKKPAVILVTSAEPGDGASLTAYAIAGAFADSGARTVLFDATSNVVSDRRQKSDSDEVGSIRVNAHANVRRPEVLQSRELLVDFVNSLKSSYEITIIETPPVMESDAANALIASADAALIALRLGRVAGEGDVLISRMLERTEDCLLGIVTTTSDAITEFERVSPKSSLAAPPTIELFNDPTIGPSLLRRISTGSLSLIFAIFGAALARGS